MDPPARLVAVRVLMSARDVGAAGHIAALAKGAVERGWEVSLVASQPALDYLERQEGLNPQPFSVEPILAPSPPAVADLLVAARQVVEDVCPDAIVVGLSHHAEAGVDEALLATGGLCRRFAMQDFWGDVNALLEAPADAYLVIDEQAAEMTLARHGATPVVVGSPKHSVLRARHLYRARESVRTALGVPSSESLVGFFGQPLQAFSGYIPMLTAVARQVALQAECFFYRAHPRETEGQAKSSVTAFEEGGLSIFDTRRYSIEELLAAADVVLTPYSSCGYDALHIHRLLPQHPVAVVYLLYEPDIRAYSRLIHGFDRMPPAEAGMASQVDKKETLASAIRAALSSEQRHERGRLVQERLLDPAGSVERALRVIAARDT
jgi:hypothetical protein